MEHFIDIRKPPRFSMLLINRVTLHFLSSAIQTKSTRICSESDAYTFSFFVEQKDSFSQRERRVIEWKAVFVWKKKKELKMKKREKYETMFTVHIKL
jgi:hypothetical protein